MSPHDLGFFLRASMNNGPYASYYTDGQRSLTAGFVLTGAKWDRPPDAIGVAGVVSGMSGSQIKYFEVGNPAYNHDRGPVSIFALRLHGEF